MEKFNLKWNDFLLNISKSFGILRKEKDFYDVSLVCDDEKIISAHKVVLSASSDLFKSILRKADHAKPMIYLNGVSSKELNNILDYIYEGEIQLFQDELDNFLAVAEKLKINGLEQEHVNDDEGKDEIETFNQDSKENFHFDNPHSERKRFHQGGVDEADVAVIKPNKTDAVVVQSQRGDNNVYDEAKRAVDEIVLKVKDGWACTTCGKTTKGISSSQIRRHAEIHIEGLSFPCHLCGNTFRSRIALTTHKSRACSISTK